MNGGPENNGLWLEPCGGFFFARNTLATGDFFLRVDLELINNGNTDDQQAIATLSKDLSFARLALDPDPLNLQIMLKPREKRETPFIYSFFPQIDIWGNFWVI